MRYGDFSDKIIKSTCGGSEFSVKVSNSSVMGSNSIACNAMMYVCDESGE